MQAESKNAVTVDVLFGGCSYEQLKWAIKITVGAFDSPLGARLELLLDICYKELINYIIYYIIYKPI